MSQKNRGRGELEDGEDGEDFEDGVKKKSIFVMVMQKWVTHLCVKQGDCGSSPQ